MEQRKKPNQNKYGNKTISPTENDPIDADVTGPWAIKPMIRVARRVRFLKPVKHAYIKSEQDVISLYYYKTNYSRMTFRSQSINSGTSRK
jgi:hypothetical protein